MTKKSHSFKNITTVLLTLLLIGIAAEPASATLNATIGAGTIVVAGLNNQPAVTSANTTAVLNISGRNGDIGSGGLTLTLGSGITWNTSTTPTASANPRNPNTALTIGTITITSTKITIPLSGVPTSDWGINVSSIFVDVPGSTAAGNILITVDPGLAPTNNNALFTVAKPTVTVNGTVTLPFGAGNATNTVGALGSNFSNITIITTKGAVGEIGLGTNINVSLPLGSGLTFGSSYPGNVTFDDGAGSILAGSTMANVSSDGLNLTAIMGIVSGSNANSVVRITFYNYSLNATTTAVNGTVAFNITLGNSSTSTYSQAVSNKINLTKPVVFMEMGQINAPLGANNVTVYLPGQLNPAAINISYGNTSVAGEIAGGSIVNITLDAGISFYYPGNVTFSNPSSNGVTNISGSSVANITNSGQTLYAVVGPASSNSSAGWINFTGFSLNISTSARNGTKFNVTTTPINASGNITTQIPLGINTTNASINLVGTNNTIFVDANGNKTASLGVLWINTTGGVAGEIGNFTNITIQLPSYTGVSFNTSNVSTTGNNTVGNITAPTGLQFNTSGLASNRAVPTIASDGTNLTVVTSNGSTATQSTIMFSGFKLNVLSTAPAGRLNFTVITTANGTGTSPLQSGNGTGGPNNNTGAALTQNFNWGSGITITPVWADAPIFAASTSSTTSMVAGSTGTFYFNITNLSNAMNFTGATGTFAVNNSAATLSTTTWTSSSPSGNISVNVTAPSTIGGFNLTVNITGPAAGFVNATNSSINVTIQTSAQTYPTKLSILTDASKLAPSQTANITVVAVDISGNNVTGITHTVQLASSTAGVTISASNPGASAAQTNLGIGPNTPGTSSPSSVAYFNVTKTSSGSVSLTATDVTNSSVTFATATQTFTVDPVSISATPASASVVSNGSVVNLSVSLLDGSGSLISLSGQSINITTSNITLGGINNNSAISSANGLGGTYALAPTNSSGIATANFTANNAGTTGTVFANASYTNASNFKLWSNVTITVTTGTPSNTTSTLNLTTTGSVAAGANASFSATLKDSTGNLIPSQNVTFSTTTGGSLSNGTASGSSVIATTNSTGVATVTLTTNTTVGTNTVMATTSTGNFNQSVSLTTVAGSAAKLVFTSATPGSIGVSLNGTLEVQLQDSNGNSNTTSGVNVSFASNNSAAGTLSASSNTTNAAGRTSVVLTGSSTGGTTVITASNTSLTSATTTIVVTPVSQIILTASKSAAAANGSDTITLTAQLANSSGGPLSISGTTITYIKSGVGNLSAFSGVTNSTGASTTTITSGTGGSAIVTASTSGVPAASVTVTFSGNATAIIVTASPSSTAVNGTITVNAQAVDAAGNNAVIFNGASISLQSVTFSTPIAVTVSNASTAFNTTGGASANVTSATAATYTVTVNGAGLTNSTSVTFTTASVLTSITVSPATKTLNIYNVTQTFTATPTDQFGNTMSGVTVTWSSSNTRVGTIASSGATTGVFTPLAKSSLTATGAFTPITITAASGSISGTASVTVVPGSRTIGLYQNSTGTFFLKNSNTAGAADITVQYGPAGLIPLAGDYDGNGNQTIGVYSSGSSGTFFLKNSNTAGAADITVQFGPGGSDFTPLIRRTDSNGTDFMGVYQTSTGTFFLKNSFTAGAADTTVQFGPGGSDFVPLSGDWTGSGTTSIGVYRKSTGTFFLKNATAAGAADMTVQFGPGGSDFLPVTGDWNSNGQSTVGVYQKSTGTFFLKNSFNAGAADITVQYGPGGSDFLPVTGDWDGR